jgi:nodulation protein E
MNEPIVVTGRGIVSAVGNSLEPFLQNCRLGYSGIRPLAMDEKFKFTHGAWIDQPDFSGIDDALLTLADPVAKYALLAARDAVSESGLDISNQPDRVAVIIGTGIGGVSTIDEGYYKLYKQGNKRVHPLTITRVMVCSAPSLVSMDSGANGPVYTVSSACSSANHAIGDTLRLLREGVIDAAITGGTEAPFSHGLLRCWEAMRVVSPDTCKPFSKDRKGLILGEGAGIIVLERESDAKARGATIYGRILGYAASADAMHITQPNPKTIISAIHKCLKDANLSTNDIDYINAHGTGTVLNEATEAEVIHAVYGSTASQLPISSTKGIHGHALGASGAMELIATLGGLQGNWIPVNANVSKEDIDPELNLNVITAPQDSKAQIALSHTFAFGGLNSILAVAP